MPPLFVMAIGRFSLHAITRTPVGCGQNCAAQSLIHHFWQVIGYRVIAGPNEKLHGIAPISWIICGLQESQIEFSHPKGGRKDQGGAQECCDDDPRSVKTLWPEQATQPICEQKPNCTAHRVTLRYWSLILVYSRYDLARSVRFINSTARRYATPSNLPSSCSFSSHNRSCFSSRSVV